MKQTKIFCDKCEREITNGVRKVTSEFALSIGRTNLEITFGPAPIKEGAAVCIYCIADEINKLDDRPKSK